MSAPGVNLAVTKDGGAYNKLSRPDNYLVSTPPPPLPESAVLASAFSGSKRKREQENASEAKRTKKDWNASRSKSRARVNDQFREPGVRSVLPGLDGEDQLTDESIDEAVAYLRSVRSEASAIPTLLVAPNDVHETGGDDGDDASDSDDKFTVGAQRAVYNDGTWVALESESEVASEYWDGQSNDLDPQESCQWILVRRFCSLRNKLSMIRERKAPSNKTAGSRKQRRGDQPNKYQWADTIGRGYPELGEVVQMDQSTLYVALHGCTLALDRSTEISRHTSCWIWTLLALTGDFGTLDHERIGKIRDLGLAASRLAKRFYDNRSSKEEHASEGEAGDDRASSHDNDVSSELAVVQEDNDFTPNTESNLESTDAVDDKTGDSDAEMVISDDDAESSDAESGDLEKARARLLAQLGDRLVQPAVPSDTPTDAAPASSSSLLSRAEAERQRQEMRENRPQLEEATHASASTSSPEHTKLAGPQSAPLTESDLETKAAIDMILTVVAECYGQRDLLQFCEAW